MERVDFFRKFVELHHKNLECCLPHLYGGAIADSSGKPLPEGSDRNQHYAGLCVIRNGHNILKKLVKEGFAQKDDITTRVSVKNDDTLMGYLDSQEHEDGVFVYDSVDKAIARICELRFPERPFEKYIPSNFVFSGRASDFIDNGTRHKIGTKTRLAIKFPLEFPDFETFQVKRSAYGHLGMGKITHFDSKGLNEEYFFKIDSKSQGPFANEHNKIVGVYRSYRFEDGGEKRGSSGLLVPTVEEIADINLKDKGGKDVRGYAPKPIQTSRTPHLSYSIHVSA